MSFICNSWYWVYAAAGGKYKQCSMGHNCPDNCICGMTLDEEPHKTIELERKSTEAILNQLVFDVSLLKTQVTKILEKMEEKENE